MRLPLFIVKTAGTKSWIVRDVLNYLSGPPWPKTIVEPFGGSGIVGLSLLNEGCCERLVLAEKDSDYLAFWRAALGDANFSYRVSKWTERVLDLPFKHQKPFVDGSLERMKGEDPGFWTLLRSRIGFNGKKVGGFMTEKSRGGILCRSPTTLDVSLDLLYSLRNRIIVMEDGFEAMSAFDAEDSYAFVDPTYTATGECPGHGQYEVDVIDHRKLVSTLSAWKGRWQLTYNLSPLPVIPSLYQLKIVGRAEIDFQSMLSGNGKGGSGKKWEMLVSKVSNERVPMRKRMEATAVVAEKHRHLIGLSMPDQRSKQLVAEKSMRVLSEIQERCRIEDEEVA